jgi:hypothetical protein
LAVVVSISYVPLVLVVEVIVVHVVALAAGAVELFVI